MSGVDVESRRGLRRAVFWSPFLSPRSHPHTGEFQHPRGIVRTDMQSCRRLVVLSVLGLHGETGFKIELDLKQKFMKKNYSTLSKSVK